MTARPLLLDVLRDPGRLAGLGVREWEAVLPMARRHGLSGRWHQALEQLGALAKVPAAVRKHLWSDDLIARDHARMMRWETNRISRALDGFGAPVVLLKGAAYLMAGIPCGSGRLVSDVDILVPFEYVGQAERMLGTHGWRSMSDNRYDERYFREWMHELPPMRHVVRGTVLDLHHNILPRTCALCPPAAPLLDHAVPSGVPGISLLNPVDMTIHSILHGFYNGEFTNCLRDILDVHELFSHFQKGEAAFAERLGKRVAALSIERPAYYALRQARRMFETNVPDELTQRLQCGAPPAPLRALMDWAIGRVFMASAQPTLNERLAYRTLQTRAHWIKMPPGLLCRHLSYKVWLRLRARFKETGGLPT